MSSKQLRSASHWSQGNNWSVTGIHRQYSRISHRIWQSLDVIFLPNMQLECCTILQDTLRDNFDIFAASGESSAWVLLWKTRSRPIGARVCLVAQFAFSAFHLIRVRGLVVFWKETSGRQPQLITLENEGGDETTHTSPPKCFDDPDVFVGPRGPPERPGPPDPSAAGD